MFYFANEKVERIQLKLDGKGRARREAARRRKSESKFLSQL